MRRPDSERNAVEFDKMTVCNSHLERELLVHPQEHPAMSDDLKSRIAELESENAHLRESANAFGELAERLNYELREERRRNAERRTMYRGSPDRRVVPFPKRAGEAR